MGVLAASHRILSLYICILNAHSQISCLIEGFFEVMNEFFI